MIDRSHSLLLARQARELGISRGSVYYLPRPVSAADLTIMRRIDELHLEFPFAGSRMLRDLLRQEGIEIGRQHVATLMKTMAIEAIYRRPNTSKPTLGHKVYPYLLRKLPIGPTRSGRLASAISRWRGGSSISWPSSIGSAARSWPGGCRSRWRPTSASRRWRKSWRATASSRFSTPTKAVRADSTGRRNTTEIGGCDGHSEARGRSMWATAIAITWAPLCCRPQ